ncbi:MAG: PsbP-related protein [Methanobacterium sp.]|jgi:hypothetical protein
MRCQNCGHENDPDAKYCEKCGSNLNKSGMPSSTKILIVVVIILVAGLGLVSGMMLMKNQQQLSSSNNTINNTTNGGSGSNNPTGSNAQYKTYSNGLVSFQYPSNWNVLPNNANTMVIAGVSSYPAFSVYNESKYGYTSLSAYVSSSESYQTSLGYSIRSEQSTTVDGFPAYEIVYQEESGSGVMVVQQMDLVELSPGSQYFALVGVDTIDHYDQEISTFNQIISSFKFLS